MNIDNKYFFHATKQADSEKAFNHKSGVVFKAADKALLATLRFYRSECASLGADQRQLDGITGLIGRVEQFQSENPDLCKVPDVDEGKEDEIVNGAGVLEEKHPEIGVEPFDLKLVGSFIEENYVAFQNFIEKQEIDGAEAEGIVDKLLKAEN